VGNAARELNIKLNPRITSPTVIYITVSITYKEHGKMHKVLKYEI